MTGHYATKKRLFLPLLSSRYFWNWPRQIFWLRSATVSYLIENKSSPQIVSEPTKQCKIVYLHRKIINVETLPKDNPVCQLVTKAIPYWPALTTISTLPMWLSETTGNMISNVKICLEKDDGTGMWYCVRSPSLLPISPISRLCLSEQILHVVVLLDQKFIITNPSLWICCL